MHEPLTPPLPAVAILGAGSMGGAILSGLLGAGAREVTVTTRSSSSASALPGGARILAVEDDPAANRSAVEGASIVVLAVKPAVVLELAREIAPALSPDAVVVSVAAGVRIDAIDRAVGGAAIVRAMPNTPATIGAGVTGIAANARVDERRRELARALFSTVGSVHEVPEDALDALTAISGSGPAYVFYFIEKLASAGEELGLPRELALELASGTVRGAAELLTSSGLDPAELRRRVTSPGGTTAQAIGVFDEDGIGAAISRATAAAARRSQELSRQYGE